MLKTLNGVTVLKCSFIGRLIGGLLTRGKAEPCLDASGFHKLSMVPNLQTSASWRNVSFLTCVFIMEDSDPKRATAGPGEHMLLWTACTIGHMVRNE